MSRLAYLLDDVSPLVAKAISQTAENTSKIVDIHVQLRSDTQNSKVWAIDTTTVFRDLKNGLRVQQKRVKKKQDAGSVDIAIAAVKAEIEDRLFSTRIKGSIELIFLIREGLFVKVMENKTLHLVNDDKNLCNSEVWRSHG